MQLTVTIYHNYTYIAVYIINENFYVYAINNKNVNIKWE